MCTLFSGSSGNCVYVSDGETRLLVDCGVSGKRIESGLKSIGVDPKQINGVLLTHEHSDHVASVGILHRRYGWNLYANSLTWNAAKSVVGKIDASCLHFFCEPFQIGKIGINPFSIPHDAADPVGYRFQKEGACVTVATDLGVITPQVEENLTGSDVVLLEANHDEEMLRMGPYPYPLKRRILSNSGHLSNENAGKLCVRLAKSGTKEFLLGHLSIHNNIPELAYQTVVSVLQEHAMLEQVKIAVAPREGASFRYTVGG
ncbi:MAG: MBL fold metallo-hydrolase [Ruminococcaceae bacterium]|nr:MBL fold metallo-hydrolase [Oscillospiraceae bacterium]